MQLLVLIGFILPPFIDGINAWIADTRLRFIVSLVFCLVVGILIEYAITGTLSFEGVATQTLAVIGAAQLTYKRVYEDSNLQNYIRGGEVLPPEPPTPNNPLEEPTGVLLPDKPTDDKPTVIDTSLLK